MSPEDIKTIIISACVGGAGFVGIIFYFLKRYIDKMLNKKEAEEEKKRKNRINRTAYNDALQHAQGRLLFWLYKAIVNGVHNGELDSAFHDFEKAEKQIKDHDRKIVAEQERN